MRGSRRGNEQSSGGARSRRRIRVLGLAALLAGCTATATPSPSVITPSSTRTEPGGATIQQPSVPGDLPVAPEGDRVDIAMPTFSDPTNITNPLFPVSQQASVLMVGRVEGKLFRTEVTLLPESRIIAWEGQEIEALISQYVAFLDGRSTEVAYDLMPRPMTGPCGTWARTCSTSGTERSP